MRHCHAGRWQCDQSGTTGIDWSAFRPSSLASQLPQGFGYICRIKSAGRPSSLASQLPQGFGYICRIRLAGRPSSRASLAPTGVSCTSAKSVRRASLNAGQETVGASLLAKDSRAPRLTSKQALSFTTIASKLAPTGGRVHRRLSPLIRPSVSSPAALDLDPPAPSGG